MMGVIERGPWEVGKTSDGRVYLQSNDFTHDVRLYVNGDFLDDDQKLAYAEEIAKRLNSWK